MTTTTQPVDLTKTGHTAHERERVIILDQAPKVKPARSEIRHRQILPTWLRSRAALRRETQWAARRAGHAAGFHGLRTPIYAARTGLYAPVGAAKLAHGTWRWILDADSRPVRVAAVDAEDADAHLRLAAHRDRRVKARAIAAGLLLAAGVGLVAAVVADIPPDTRWVLLAATVVALAAIGTPRDKPLIRAAIVRPEFTRLTSDMVEKAMAALGIAAIRNDGVHFAEPIVTDGPGWRATIDLPLGVTAGDVVDRRDRLASGLRRPLGCVWPEGDRGIHEGRLVLWVGKEDMAKAKQPAWPLLAKGSVDLFDAQPVGTDQRGRPVDVTLMFISAIIGALPRMGKSFLLRLLLLVAALDPRAELHAFDLKGTGDFAPLEQVCHSYRAGDESEDIEYIVDDYRALLAEMRRRAKVIRNLPKDLCPENKVTTELADKPELGLHPIIIGADEVQKLFEHPVHGAELEEIATDLGKRGPALGIVQLLATQRVDSKSLPTGISSNAILRFCLRVMGQVENDMVLGTSMYKAGIRATTFARSDRGIAWMAGEGDDPAIVRIFYVDGPTAQMVADRARQVRADVGRLSGHAAGETRQPTAPEYDLLADIQAVIGADIDPVWSEALCERLMSLRPSVYVGWGPRTLQAALKPLGVETRQVGRRVDGEVVNRRGVDPADVREAIARR